MDDNNIKNVTVLYEEECYVKKALELAGRLGISVADDKDKVTTELYLLINDDGLSLSDGKNTMRGDFSQKLSRLKPNNLNGELLVKASKINGVKEELTLIDATAGMGEDALILAASGFNVKLYEYNPIIRELLKDTMDRAKQNPDLEAIVNRMELCGADSIEAMENLSYKADVILLDPMFPARQKSALVKKKFQLLQHLEQPCSNEEDLLSAAISVHPRKIVIKRMAKGPYLAGRKPDYSLQGKAIRYDIINSVSNMS